ncbi:hypothetical protein QJS10_CPA10g02006 [Acorus calamus]|uniref:Uncharacterized protein n=1 Tax=Acorus calamus TaxID=4465 RepID=A0AAV9E118_ACOCL|nr:hypothetical protein QJS10_CPA10g02006 [Acorus calamus]
MVATTSETTIVVVPWALLNGTSCNGSIAEFYGEEERLLIIGESSENGLQRHLLAHISEDALKKDRPVYSVPRGQSYTRPCEAYYQCRK